MRNKSKGTFLSQMNRPLYSQWRCFKVESGIQFMSHKILLLHKHVYSFIVHIYVFMEEKIWRTKCVGLGLILSSLLWPLICRSKTFKFTCEEDTPLPFSFVSFSWWLWCLYLFPGWPNFVLPPDIPKPLKSVSRMSCHGVPFSSPRWRSSESQIRT